MDLRIKLTLNTDKETVTIANAKKRQKKKQESHSFESRCKHWEKRWVLEQNVWNHSGEIWLFKWVPLDEIEEESPRAMREYRCTLEDCGKVFSDASALRKHAVTHGERQFICTYEGCGKKFLDNSKLRRHQLVHTGEKPYECHICHKRFSLDFNLRTHMRTHTGEKPYQCSYPGCLKRFTQSSNLAAHERTHKKLEEQKAGDEEVGKDIQIRNNTNMNTPQHPAPHFSYHQSSLLWYFKSICSFSIHFAQFYKIGHLITRSSQTRDWIFFPPKIKARANFTGSSLSNNSQQDRPSSEREHEHLPCFPEVEMQS